VDQIQTKGGKNFYTIDVIKLYLGHYFIDTNANESINANNGKFIKKNMVVSGIAKEIPNQPSKDKNNKASHSSLWEFNL
jgi:hypothetical protein